MGSPFHVQLFLSKAILLRRLGLSFRCCFFFGLGTASQLAVDQNTLLLHLLDSLALLFHPLTSFGFYLFHTFDLFPLGIFRCGRLDRLELGRCKTGNRSRDEGICGIVRVNWECR